MTRRIRIKKSKEVKKQLGIPGEGGLHSHFILDGQPKTELDGAHGHLFIINGLPFMTEYDGAHEHKVDSAGNRLGQETIPHVHVVKMNGDTLETSDAPGHIHELAGPNYSTHSGTHRHTLETVDGKVYTSLLAGDLMNQEVRKSVNLQIHQLIIDRSKFPDIEKVIAMLASKGFMVDSPEKSDSTFIFRQLSRERFIESSLKEFEMSDGIKAIVGILDPEENDDEDEKPSFDKLKDSLDLRAQIMSNEQVATMARLKDEFANKVADLKVQMGNFIPVLNKFSDLADDLISNEAFHLFLTGFVDATQVLIDELGRIEISTKKSVGEVGNFESELRKLRAAVKDVRKIFEGSSSFANFGTLLLTIEDGIEQLLIEVPTISAEASGTELAKAFNDYIDLEDFSLEELQNISADELKKLKVKDFDIAKVGDERLSEFLRKFKSEDEQAHVTLEYDPEHKSFMAFLNGNHVFDYDVNKGLPFPKDKIDVVTIKNCLELVENENRVKVISEVHRVLKKGGIADIQVSSTVGENAFLPIYKSYWNETTLKMFVKDSYLNKMLGLDIAFESDILKTEVDESSGLAFVIAKLRKP